MSDRSFCCVVCETLLPLESEKAIFMTTRSFRARIATLGFERIREPVRTLPFGDRQKLSCRFFVPALFCWFSLSISANRRQHKSDGGQKLK